MARTPTILTDLSKFSGPDAIVQYKQVGNGMRLNPNFPNPDVVYIKFDAAGSDYEAQIADKPRTPPKTAIIKKSRLLLNKYYKEQGNYVIRICNGDEVMLKTSNFIMGSDGEPRVNPFFSAKNGLKSGDVIFTSKSNKTVCSYWIDCRLVSDTTPNEWEFCKITGIHTGTKSGFISGLVYEFRMKYIYSTTESEYFESVTLRMM